MDINKDLIDKIAKLSRLDVPVEQKEKLAKEFVEIVSYVERISELELENIEPMERPGKEPMPLREDTSRETLPVEKALENAPEKSDKKFKVPRVI